MAWECLGNESAGGGFSGAAGTRGSQRVTLERAMSRIERSRRLFGVVNTTANQVRMRVVSIAVEDE